MAKTFDSSPSRSLDKAAVVSSGKRIQVRRSGVHGKGVFALQDIAKGETLIEYVGEVISWDEAQDRHPHDPQDPNHTFYFHVNEDRVIDALYGGNSSRWINHSCKPNCEADEENDRIFIKAIRNISAGEELNYDYGLIIDEPYTPKLKAEYPCWCGAKNCRGTLLSPKDRADTPKTPKQKKAKSQRLSKEKAPSEKQAKVAKPAKKDRALKTPKLAKEAKAAKPVKAEKAPKSAKKR